MSTIAAIFRNQAPDDTSNRKRLIRDTLIEGLATTLFVFFGTFSVISTGRKLVGSGEREDVARVLPIAMAFGVSIMVLVYAIGHITGKLVMKGRTRYSSAVIGDSQRITLELMTRVKV